MTASSTDARPDPRSHLLNRWWEAIRRHPDLSLASLVFVLQTVCPTPQTGDSRLSVTTAWQFLTHFNLHLESYRSVTSLSYRADLVHHGGHLLPFFPWPTMLFALPADLLFRLVGHHPQLLSITNPNRTSILETPTASLLVALTAVFVRRIVLGLERWGRPALATMAALWFAFATSAWSVGSRALWQQTVSMFFLAALVLALQRLDRGRPWPMAAGALAAMAYVTRPTNSLIVVLVLAWVAWRRRRHLVPLLSGMAAVGVVFGAFSMWQYGQVLPPYYAPGRLGDQGPFDFGQALLVNLVSPARGLLLFDPLALLAGYGLVVRARSPTLGDLDVVMALFCLGLLVVVAEYGSTGGATYGPRLMTDTLPFLTILALPAFDRLSAAVRSKTVLKSATATVVVVVLVWSLFVNATGATMRSAYCWSADPTPIDQSPSRVWSWSDPQFLRPYRDLVDGQSLNHVIAGSCRQTTSSGG